MNNRYGQESALCVLHSGLCPVVCTAESCSLLSRFSCSLSAFITMKTSVKCLKHWIFVSVGGTFICKMIFLFIKWHFVYWMSTNIIPRKLYAGCFQGCFLPPLSEAFIFLNIIYDQRYVLVIYILFLCASVYLIEIFFHLLSFL